MVLAAEIQSLITVGKIAAVDIEANIETLSSVDFRGTDIYTVEPTYAPVYEKSIERMGLLTRQDADDVVNFYGHLLGVRAGIRNLFRSGFAGLPNAQAGQHASAKKTLELWEKAQDLGGPLIVRLNAVSSETWLNHCCTLLWNVFRRYGLAMLPAAVFAAIALVLFD